MQSIEQRHYRETEEQNSNGCKLLVIDIGNEIWSTYNDKYFEI